MMELSWWLWVAIPLAGAVAGFVNSMAGAGSLLTLPLLMLSGLPANVANGSNRVGILVQSLTSFWTYRRSGVGRGVSARWLVVPIVLGAVSGAVLAGHVGSGMMGKIIAVVMLPMVALLFVRPEKLRRNRSRLDPQEVFRRPYFWLIILAVSFYGGFVQVGANFLILLVLTVVSGMDLLTANAVKLLIQLVFTLSALPVYIYNGLVDWLLSLLMAAGCMGGSWLGVRLAVKRGQGLVKVVMVVCVLLFSANLLLR